MSFLPGENSFCRLLYDGEAAVVEWTKVFLLDERFLLLHLPVKILYDLPSDVIWNLVCGDLTSSMEIICIFLYIRAQFT